MKKQYALFLLLPLMLLLTACPVGTNYPLGNPGTEKIDNNLIGTWENSEADPEAKKVSIKRADNFSYDIEVFDPGSQYTLTSTTLKGWVTPLEGKQFVYIRAENEETFYLYCYKIQGNVLTTWDVGLLVGGIDAVTSTQAFRDEVAASLKKMECLTDEINWTKL